jgi:eukaryotic-like serine/threonine-protein kinase
LELPQRYKTLTKSVLAGGFGTVVPLEDTFLRRVVLLKVMQDAANNAQLQNELKSLCKARSRHVVEVYDVIANEKGEIVGVVIERLRGRDFSAFHEEATNNPQGYLKVLYQISCALRDLHAVGIVHRDLKLDNFKESAAGIVKLFDFGISSPDGGYKTMQNRGTLTYAAPELYVPGTTITPEMDIYALGVCAWALAYPKFPTQLLEKPPQASGRSPSISSVMPTADKQADGLHKEVIDILDACLDPQPKGRPSADRICSVLTMHLIRNKHRGLFLQGNQKVTELSAKQPSVTLKIGTLGGLTVTYDGIRFSITEVKGSVSINNVPAVPGNVLHEACVLGFGDASLESARQWVTFFASHPEVVL